MTTTTTTSRTITVTKGGKPKSVVTSYGDVQALHLLRQLTKKGAPLHRSTFACSLAKQAEEAQLSEKQMAWVHVLVIENEQPTETSEGDEPKLDGILAIMDKASEDLRYPKITLQTESGQRVRLARTGYRSANPGVINITDGRPYGENIWYGRISRDGKLRSSQAMTEEVQALLLDFDRDPSGHASAHGHRTGSCCFCARTLSDARSVSVGYGPICADRYGLAWGDAS